MKTNYLGLELSSPVIASSCGLTSTTTQIVKFDKAGVGAVVLKSIFEEQILGERSTMDHGDYNDAYDYINSYVKQNVVANYIDLIKECKKECSAKIIASINCTQKGEWVSFAKSLESAGADAIELNIYFMAQSASESSSDLEKKYLDTAAAVVEAVSIPVSVKLPINFTNPLYIIRELYFRGVKGVVMFNRFYEPEINVKTLSVGTSDVLTQKGEGRELQRWIALAKSEVPQIDIAATTGVESGEDCLKMILAGAKAVEVCSVLYAKGESAVSEMNSEIESFCSEGGYSSLTEVCGKLSFKNVKENAVYQRAQFMKYYSNFNK